jgi:hypothetical protein
MNYEPKLAGSFFFNFFFFFLISKGNRPLLSHTWISINQFLEKIKSELPNINFLCLKNSSGYKFPWLVVWIIYSHVMYKSRFEICNMISYSSIGFNNKLLNN